MPIFRRTKTVCVTAYGVLLWFCWMWLLAVVGAALQDASAVKVTVGTVTFTVLTSYEAAPHNRYQPHPAEPAQHTICSNTRSLFSWRWA